MNLPNSPKPNSNPTPTASECNNCMRRERFLLLHNVRLRGIYRRLCTSCVLRLHPSSFCPLCFSLYDSSPPPPSKRLSCSNCHSLSHSQCATCPSSPFLCPPCSDPDFDFFPLHRLNRVVDKRMAAVLLCAARISAASMGKAVLVARAEAERRVREAALCRKRAREALEHVAFVVAKEEKVAPARSKEVVESSLAVVPVRNVSTAAANNGKENLGRFGSNNAQGNVVVKEDPALVQNNS